MQQQQPDKPASTPTPEDPRQRTPMQDPPVHPEHDSEGPTKIAGGAPGTKPESSNEESVRGHQPGDDESSDLEANGAKGAIRANDPSPDQVVFDENKSQR
jgi:hypothetical protein